MQWMETLARLVDIKRLVHIDGDLLDNIIDYFTYVIVPSFFLWESTLLPPSFRLYAISLIIIASCYQFTQTNAKNVRSFFYWISKLLELAGILFVLLSRLAKHQCRDYYTIVCFLVLFLLNTYTHLE